MSKASMRRKWSVLDVCCVWGGLKEGGRCAVRQWAWSLVRARPLEEAAPGVSWRSPPTMVVSLGKRLRKVSMDSQQASYWALASEVAAAGR